MILADEGIKIKEQIRFGWFNRFAANHLNFYRIHMIYFTFTPLIAAAIFYASNGETHVPFNDALFLCISSMTVTGLNSFLLAPITRWQQVILFLLMCMGSLTSVSLVTILIRRHFFRAKFAHMVEHDPVARKLVQEVEMRQAAEEGTNMHKLLHPSRFFFTSPGGPIDSARVRSLVTRKKKNKTKNKSKVSAGMIRKVDDDDLVARTISQLQADRDAEKEGLESVELSERKSSSSAERSAEPAEPAHEAENTAQSPVLTEEPLSMQQSRHMHFEQDIGDHSHEHHADGKAGNESADDRSKRRRNSEVLPRSPMALDRHFPRVRTMEPTSHRMPRVPTIDFVNDKETELRHRNSSSATRPRRPSTANLQQRRNLDMYRSKTTATQMSSRHTGFGGFPNPVKAAFEMAADRFHRAVENKTTMSRTDTVNNNAFGRTVTFVGNNSGKQPDLKLTRTGTIASLAGVDVRPAPYINFDAVVGRNSHFHALTSAQAEELGGVEYKALNLLSKIVAGYWFFLQLGAVTMGAPYLSQSAFDYIFRGDGGTNPTWYTIFNVFSAFSNNGMSLLDSSMTMFNENTYWPLVLMVMILAGNTAFPIFLRLAIWIFYKLTPATSPRKETLQFLLDHPRRCFLYLFPSHQTWLLVVVLILLNGADWFSFLVLDINNEVLDQIPLRHRVLDGLFQAFAVRAAGFGIVNYSAAAPAVLVLYVIMMYIAVYPIALSIRSTNVYEEKSMGLYQDEDEDMESQFDRQHVSPGSYIAYHARKQLAFDAWWLLAALFLICIIQRDQIADPSTNDWFTVFTVLFELTSAYGTVGLSLGSPVTGTSLCGSFRILSKVILMAVMIRGRHRGLPIAIDRAVLVPSELKSVDQASIRPTDVDSRSLKRQMSRDLSRTMSRTLQDYESSSGEESSTSEEDDDARPTSRTGDSKGTSIPHSSKVEDKRSSIPQRSVTGDVK